MKITELESVQKVKWLRGNQEARFEGKIFNGQIIMDGKLLKIHDNLRISKHDSYYVTLSQN